MGFRMTKLESTENEIKELMRQCFIIRNHLKKSISEILEYTKAFEEAEPDLEEEAQLSNEED